jgi:hypothetical protein
MVASKKKIVAVALFFLVTLAVHARGGNDPSVTVTTHGPGGRLIAINWTQVKNPFQNTYTLYRANRGDRSFTAIKSVSVADHQFLDENLPSPMGNFFYFVTHESFEKLNQGVRITDAEIAAQLATLPENERMQTSGSYPYAGGYFPPQGGTANAALQTNRNTRQVNEGISLGLIIFTNKVETESALLPLDPAGRQELVERLNAAYIPSRANGTALYYAEHTAIAALNRLDAAKVLPSNLESVNIITFTTGLDTSSTDVSLPSPDGVSFAGVQSGSGAYRNFINQQIKTKRIGGKRIDAWAIGATGRNAVNGAEFQATLNAVSSSPENVSYISNVAEIERPLLGIAGSIKISAQRSSLMFTTPAYPVGTIVRLTFDSAYHPDSSAQYVEGRIAYNNNAYMLTNIRAEGLPLATNNGVVSGRRGDGGIEYTIAIDDDFPDRSIMQWYKPNSLAGDDWQQNSEFKTLKLNDYTSGRKSAAVYLVLDCSSMLSEADVDAVRRAAMLFIDRLYNVSGGYDLATAAPPVQYNQTVLSISGPTAQNTPPASAYPPSGATQYTRIQVNPAVATEYTQIQSMPSAGTQYTYIQAAPAPAQWARIQTTPAPALPPSRMAPPAPAPVYLNLHLPPKSVIWDAPYSGFWVQTGSYTDVTFAQDCWRKLFLSGCADAEIFSKDINGVMYYRVKVGPYQDRQTAELTRDILRGAGVDYRDCYVVKQ